MFLVLTIHLHLTSGNANVQPVVPQVRVVSGAYVSPVPGITMYESEVPVRFQIELPTLYELIAHPSCQAEKYLCELVTNTYNAYTIMKSEYLADFPYTSKGIFMSKISERGLFNFVGNVQNFLFGTATESEVSTLDLNYY